MPALSGNEESVIIKYNSTGFKKVSTEVKKLGSGFEEVVKRQRGYTSSGRRVMSQTKLLSKEVRKIRSQFQMWALSFLFAGMIIKQTAQRIAQSTTKAFLDMERGQTAAGQSLLRVQAAFKFLSFEVGRAIGMALKPLLPIIISIVKGFAQFVQNNPALVFASIAAAFTLGAGLFLGGQMVMFGSALLDLAGKMPMVKTALASLVPLLKNIGKLAAITVGVFFAEEAIEKAIEGDLIGTITNTLFSASGFAASTGALKLAGALAMIGLAVKVVGDKEFSDKFAEMLAKVSRLVFAFGVAVGKAIKDSIARPLTLLSSGFKKLRDGDLKGAFKDFSEINVMSFLGADILKSGSSFKKDFKSAFSSFDLEASKRSLTGVLDAPRNVAETGSINGQTTNYNGPVTIQMPPESVFGENNAVSMTPTVNRLISRQT